MSLGLAAEAVKHDGCFRRRDNTFLSPTAARKSEKMQSRVFYILDGFTCTGSPQHVYEAKGPAFFLGVKERCCIALLVQLGGVWAGHQRGRLCG